MFMFNVNCNRFKVLYNRVLYNICCTVLNICKLKNQPPPSRNRIIMFCYL